MTALIGALLTVLGAAGAGVCTCREREQRIRQLENLERVFEMMAGEISYSRISLPEVLAETGEKMRRQWDRALGETLCRVAAGLCDGSGQDVETVWKEEMGRFLKESRLTGREKETVLSFPASVWFLDGPRQQAAVRAFAQEMSGASARARETKREENRLTMALSLAGGIFAAILLL